MRVEKDSNSAIRGLHAQVDSAVAPLTTRHAERLRCGRGCTQCCVDELTVSAAEAERIRHEYPTVIQEEAAPVGACAFLGAEGECRVYDARPYVCRTQGLPLRWFGEHEGEVVELRDICPLNDAAGDEALETLAAEDCWLLGPVEGQLAMLSGAAARVSLRGMFHG
ncbi:MAG: Fe-S-cluster containining protein [Bradymonadia bacterium]|jgi:Fe-S-cluster containining protein